MTESLGEGCRWAQSETVKKRQQSCRQQSGADWISGSCWPSRMAFRMQQACGAGVEIARATGAKALTNSRISNNLAVKRRIRTWLAPTSSD